MRYRIAHTTHYMYAQPVKLHPHTLRLYPRSDGAQWLREFDISLTPSPAQQTYSLDIHGNTCLKLSFTQPLSSLRIETASEVTTHRDNPFDYLSEPWAVQLPIDYPSSVANLLNPYWHSPAGQGVDEASAPAVVEIARQLKQAANNNVGFFLTQLTHYIPQRLSYQLRLHGEPYTPSLTLEKGAGTCRDFAMLFVAVCRAVGLAARFVSGYQEGDLEGSLDGDLDDNLERDATHDLHAWAEVYIPGGGWRGFDPTLGLAVSNRHIAIAAAPLPQQAAPVSGTLKPTVSGEVVKTTLENSIRIHKL